MQVHFVHRHVHDTVVFLEEGNLPLPRCPRCDLQGPRKALNGRHLGTCILHWGHPIYLMTQHGKAEGRRRLWTPQTEGGGRTYMLSFPTKGGPRNGTSKTPW